MAFEQTAEWWREKAPDGTPHHDMSPRQLQETYGEIAISGWGKRRCAGIEQHGQRDKHPDGVPFPVLKRGYAATKAGEVAVAPVEHPVEVDLTTEEKVERDGIVIRLRATNRELKSKYESAVKENSLHAEVLSLMDKYLSGRVHPCKVRSRHIGSGSTVEDAILGHADWHGGERVDYDVMQGFNAYSPEILCRRVQRTVDKTLALLFDNHSGTTFEKLYAFDLGDKITGDLLPDNMATNAMGVFESMLFIANIRARALTELSEHIPIVDIEIPGNHGRRTAKMPWKQPTETADWLIAEMVRMLTAGNDRIEVIAPKAWTAVVNIRGWNHSLNHGYSSAKGGYGGIPFYAFQRADGKKTALEHAHDRRVHYRWYGHIHTPAELPKMDGSGTQFVVGSLKGGDEYALEELNTYSDPVQKLVGCHEKYGVTWRYDLQVKFADNEPSRYEDAIDEVLI